MIYILNEYILLLNIIFRLQSDSPPGISAAPTENNILLWTAVIFGPCDTSFEDGTFKLSLEFTEEYPNKPPSVKFVSEMFHPNVYTDGAICVDVLNSLWSPTYDVSSILTSIQSLLDEPNPQSAANSGAAQLYLNNRREYDKKVRLVVEKSWQLPDNEKSDLVLSDGKESNASTTTPTDPVSTTEISTNNSQI